MADLRSALEQAFDNPATEADNYVSEPVEEIESNDEPLRNEKGQFVSKEEAETPVKASADEVTQEVEEQVEEKPAIEAKPALNRPTTWKKEYLNIWDRLEKNEPVTKEEFTKFAEYANQRENEYKKGVSVYRDVANRILPLEHTIAP